jgi:hypothetical protein
VKTREGMLSHLMLRDGELFPMVITRAFMLAGLCVVGWSLTTPVLAQNSAPLAATDPQVRTAAKPAAPKLATPYFIEFRARSALSYGHTFAVYGRVGQKNPALKVAGLHPFTDSSIPWMIGHLVPVPSETGASDGDTEDQYIIARYRVLLSEAEYKKLLANIKKLQDSSPVWHAVLYNCNAFVGDIAKSIGLKAPPSLQMPKEYIEDMRQINTNGRGTVTVGHLRQPGDL